MSPLQHYAHSRAAKLSLLNFLSLFRDLLKSTRFSEGGVVAEFFRVLQKPTQFSGGGGGSTRIFPGSPAPDHIRWGRGGGVVTQIFSYLQLPNHIFTPHRAIFMGRDTHFWLDTAKIRISC